MEMGKYRLGHAHALKNDITCSHVQRCHKYAGSNYSRRNSTRSLTSVASNFSEPKLMLQVVTLREVVGA
jgi:hypothetical protein